MEKQTTQTAPGKCRKNERGAALITVLMISFLLIVAAAALLFAASSNTSDVTDASAEEQAYYAAESGIQSVINVLRGNTVLPNALRIDTTKPATDPANKIDYLKAFKLCTSNTSCNCATSACSSSLDDDSRLSRWLSYDTTYTDRVILGASTSATQPTYNPRTGFAYKVKIENPDNVGNIVSYNTVGNIDNKGVGNPRTWGSLSISYVPRNASSNVSSGQAVTDFGKFVITGSGTIPTRVRFTVSINMTEPYSNIKVIRGYIEPGTVTNASVGSVRILYDSQVYIITGSTITLSPPGTLPQGTIVEDTVPTMPDNLIRSGYQVAPNAPSVSGGETPINASITAPEPLRLLIRSTGFGPQNAQKQLEAIIQKNYFDGLSAPSPLTLIGPPNTTNPNTVFNFDPGTATGVKYNGKDVQLKAFLPPIGVTNDINLAAINYAITKGPPNKYNGKVFGTPTNIADELPFWLQSTTNLNNTLQTLKDVAKASGRYYGPGVTPPVKDNYGDLVTAKGITFIDGDLEFGGTGGGILVVTGGLTIKGGFDFNGLMLITGKDGLYRKGGGNGNLQGNMIVAPYLPGNLDFGFLAPQYAIEGGGTSEIVYNSNNVGNGLDALSNFVKGVAEK